MDVLGRNNVQTHGNPDGPPMVFAHGFGCDQNMWRFVWPAFAQTHRIVLFDHVGARRLGPRGLRSRRATPRCSGYAAGRPRDLRGARPARRHLRRPLRQRDDRRPRRGASEPERFARLVLVGPSPRYIDDEGYVGGFAREDIDELLESMDSNYLGWSGAMAPVIMGNADRPELGDELTNSFCRADPDIARALRRGDVPLRQPRRPRAASDAEPGPAVLRRRHRARRGRRVRRRAAAEQQLRRARRHRALPEPERARGDRSTRSRTSSRRDGRRRACSRSRPRSSSRTRPAATSRPGSTARSPGSTGRSRPGPGCDARRPRRHGPLPGPADAGRPDLPRDALRAAAADAGRGARDRRRDRPRRRLTPAGAAQLRPARRTSRASRGVVRTTVFDATDRRRYEQELLRAQRQRARRSRRSSSAACCRAAARARRRLELAAAYRPAVARPRGRRRLVRRVLARRRDTVGLVVGDVVGRGIAARRRRWASCAARCARSPRPGSARRGCSTRSTRTRGATASARWRPSSTPSSTSPTASCATRARAIRRR